MQPDNVKMVTIFPLMVKTSEIQDQAVQKCRGGLEKLLVTHFYDIQWFEKSKQGLRDIIQGQICQIWPTFAIIRCNCIIPVSEPWRLKTTCIWPYKKRQAIRCDQKLSKHPSIMLDNTHKHYRTLVYTRNAPVGQQGENSYHFDISGCIY